MVTFQLKPGSASLLALVSTPHRFVSQAGNTTQLTIDIVQFLSAKFFPATAESPTEASEALERMSRFVPVIVGFALGGFAAAYFILVSETWWSLVLPLVVVSVLAIAAYVEHDSSLSNP